MNWGLDPLGVERVLATVAALETGAAVDMTTWELTNIDVRKNLTARLKNARDLKAACVEAVEGALRCEWLQEWLVEAEGDSGSGFSGVLAPKEKILA